MISIRRLLSRTSVIIVTGLLGTASVIVVWASLQDGLGMPERNEEIIEQLHQPARITGWDEHGLLLKDGRIVTLPGCLKMPAKSTALEQFTRRGIEIAPGGRVVGLVRVWHWCGNDPVREHVARVDIADALLFLKEGEWEAPSSEITKMYLESSARSRPPFSERGWEVSSFWTYESFHENLEESRIRR